MSISFVDQDNVGKHLLQRPQVSETQNEVCTRVDTTSIKFFIIECVFMNSIFCLVTSNGKDRKERCTK
jgi:hypothetical protein